MLPIVQAPDQVLAQKAKPVSHIDQNILRLIKKMQETLESAHDPEGIGLAAPQIGKSIELFIIKESKKDPLLTFINPVIKVLPSKKPKKAKPKKEKDEKEEVKLEGCLSLKDIWGIVKRDDKVEVSYQDEKGAARTEVFSGFLATIIQHEYDHLQGILFPRRVLEQKGTLYKSVINKKGEMEFQELAL